MKLIVIAVFSVSIFFGDLAYAELFEEKFVAPVICEAGTTGKKLKITADGKIEMTDKDGKTTILPFQRCWFNMSGVLSSPDKLASYKCESDGLASRYVLEMNNSGKYNLIEYLQVGKGWIDYKSGRPTKIPTTTLQREIGTFTCKDPSFDAWVDAQNKSHQDMLQKSQSIRR